ncbi:MAG: hypothetical protein RIR11_3186 [Bacteroidota bacterium]|jgi:hypothetical protein
MAQRCAPKLRQSIAVLAWKHNLLIMSKTTPFLETEKNFAIGQTCLRKKNEFNLKYVE